MVMQMHLKQLKAFLIVYEEGSFGRAAVRSRSTQPGLSVQISALEQELNVKLFHRHARGVEPTAEGRQLYRRGVQLVELANSVTQEIIALSGNVTGAVSAGISPALGRAVLASTLSQFVARFPNVDLRVSEDYSSTLLSLIESQALDFAIVAHVPNHPTIRFKHFFQDPFVVVSSRLAGLAPLQPVHLDKAPYHKFVVPSVHHGLQSALDIPFRSGSIVSQRTIEVNSLSGVLEFVATTDWLALLPYTSVHCGLDTSRLQINPIAGSNVRIDYYVACAATEPLSAAAQAFVEIVANELKSIQASAIRLMERAGKKQEMRPRKNGKTNPVGRTQRRPFGRKPVR